MQHAMMTVLALALAAGWAGCDQVEEPDDMADGGDADGDTDGDTDGDADGDTDGDSDADLNLTGVDILVVVDNSISMSQEQAVLASAVYPLVNALAAPIHTEYPETNWPYAAIDDMRLAVVSSDMGFSYDGQNNNDNWPGSTLPYGCDAPTGLGDNGAFQEIGVGTVELANDAIPCDETAAQCPEGWTCAGAEESDETPGQGVCHTDGSTTLSCPDLAGDWDETSSAAPNPDFTVLAACLAMQGTGGCGFEQQLQSAATALARTDQAAFFATDHLLAVIVVSDEEDCSMLDGPGLFAEDEVVNQEELKLNVACGNHPEHLFPVGHFYDAFVAAKAPGAVVFAAIAGVPHEGAAAAACQGPGNQLDGCLDQNEMQLVAEQPDAPMSMTWFFRPACARSVGDEEVTRAYPGRRYVGLAQEFGSRGYVYSICNDDWMPAFSSIGALIRPIINH
jgi:hypothetical protein